MKVLAILGTLVYNGWPNSIIIELKILMKSNSISFGHVEIPKALFLSLSCKIKNIYILFFSMQILNIAI